MKAIAQSRFLYHGIIPRENKEDNKEAVLKGRNYLFRILVEEYECVDSRTFYSMCDHIVAASSPKDTLLLKVWTYYQTEFIKQVQKMIQSIIHPSPTVFGLGCLKPILTTSLGEVTPIVAKDLYHPLSMGGISFDVDGHNVNFSDDVSTYFYVSTIRCIFKSILNVISLIAYIRSCPKKTLKSDCIVALQLNDLQNLIDDGEVGSAVRALKHLHVMQKIFQERIERSQDDDDFNLSKQESIIFERCSEIVDDLNKTLGSCTMQIFRSFMRDGWESYWVNPIRADTCGYHSTEKTFEHLEPTFMAFGAKVWLLL